MKSLKPIHLFFTLSYFYNSLDIYAELMLDINILLEIQTLSLSDEITVIRYSSIKILKQIDN